MASIARMSPDAPAPGEATPWPAIARQVVAWARERGIDLRDAVVFVPFVQHLPAARRAWAGAGGWMPRIETPQTLAQSLGPASPHDATQLSFDPGADRLAAARLLRTQPTFAAWARRDDRVFEETVAALVTTAHALARAGASVAPARRAQHWQAGRELLAPLGGTGATERMLARIALEWAAASGEFTTDRLFDLAPSAWIAVQAVAPDPLVHSLMHAAGERSACLLIDADPVAQAGLPSASNDLSLAACEGFEDEAQSAAAQVLDHLRAGRTPVGLVAQDRLLVRRVRALLERHAVGLLDETGWKLSTTRAGAELMSLLRSARAEAATDQLLDWLKAGDAPWPGLGDIGIACTALETICRRHAWARVSSVVEAKLPGAARALWHAVIECLALLGDTKRRNAQEWLSSLRGALVASGRLEALAADEAGLRMLRALNLLDETPVESAVRAQSFMTLDEFGDWVDSVLEETSFVPSGPAGAAPVVVTSLAHVALRPFAALVLPGADERRLGVGASPHAWLSDAQAGALGLPDDAQRRAQEAAAFAHALRMPHVTLMYRRSDNGEPLSVSPLVERTALALQRQGQRLQRWVDPRVRVPVGKDPSHRPAPAAPDRLPMRLSAAACTSLRACPYQFFARYVLGAREAEEIESELEKRDYGTWLHAVLHEFHKGRAAPESHEAELARLHAVAEEQRLARGLSEEEFLPFGASFDELAPNYIRWVHERDAQGATWSWGEREHRLELPDSRGEELYGIVDRADRVGSAMQLIDYKTGNVDDLKKQVRDRLEDTQLAVYAALVGPTADAPLQAMYLALDSRKGIEQVEHPDVQKTAAELLRGLSNDLAQLRGGAGMPALGEGLVCERCDARGLCRRDHWPEEERA